MRLDDRARLAQMGMNASHNKDVLLVAILQETADLWLPLDLGYSHGRQIDYLATKLQRLRTLAEKLRDSGRVEHDPRVVGIVIEDGDDYQRVEHDPKEED